MICFYTPHLHAANWLPWSNRSRKKRIFKAKQNKTKNKQSLPAHTRETQSSELEFFLGRAWQSLNLLPAQSGKQEKGVQSWLSTRGVCGGGWSRFVETVKEPPISDNGDAAWVTSATLEPREPVFPHSSKFSLSWHSALSEVSEKAQWCQTSAGLWRN